MPSLFDPNTSVGSIAMQVLAAIVFAICLVVWGWLYGPIKRWRDGRKIRRVLLSGRRFRFVYRPGEDKSKFVTFLSNGQIGEGHNSNENTWRIRKGRLEIFAQDGVIYSRFRFEPASGKLIHTNDVDCERSVFGQYFEPYYKPWPKEGRTNPST